MTMTLTMSITIIKMTMTMTTTQKKYSCWFDNKTFARYLQIHLKQPIDTEIMYLLHQCSQNDYDQYMSFTEYISHLCRDIKCGQIYSLLRLSTDKQIFIRTFFNNCMIHDDTIDSSLLLWNDIKPLQLTKQAQLILRMCITTDITFNKNADDIKDFITSSAALLYNYI